MHVEALNASHDRASFASGVEALDRYLHTQAGQDARKHIAATFVLRMEDGRIAGYYTLSATSIALAELPAALAKRLPRYPRIPATLLGRLATDARYRGQGYGRFLLADSLFRVVRSEIATYAVIVDAKDDAAYSFYKRESFLPFPDGGMRLFRPVADFAGLFG